MPTEIDLIRLIDTIKTGLSARKRYCFILGAGASVSSGIRSGAALAREWLKELRDMNSEYISKWIKNSGINDDNAGEHYKDIYTKRFDEIDPETGYIELQKEMDGKEPSFGYYHLARILTETSANLVITTNFDSLTEDSIFMYTHKKPLVITHESLAKYLNVLSDRPIIAKIHRDLSYQPNSSNTDILAKEWKAILKRILELYIPMVIGYGGNDGSLMGFLGDDEVASNEKSLYWCHMNGESPHKKITDLLSKYKSFLISIEGFDKTMFLMGTKLGYSFSEETVRKTTEERIQRYTESERKYKDELESKKKQGTLSNIEISTVNAMTANDEKRIIELTKKIKENPKNAEYYDERGNSYYNLKEYKKAIDDTTEAIKLVPDNDIYYYNRSVCYYALKEYEKAIDDMTEVIKLDPDGDAFNSRGNSYYNLKEYKKAIDDYTKAIEHKPDNGVYYSNRGKSYQAIGEDKKANADYAKAKELGFDDKTQK